MISNIASQKQFFSKGKVGKVELVNFNESSSIDLLTNDEVIAFLNKLPGQYYDCVPLTKIVFVAKEMYSFIKDNQLIYSESQNLDNGELLSRKRKINISDKMSNGNISIELLSTKNWNHKNDFTLDKQEALIGLGAGLGQALVDTIFYGEKIYRVFTQYARVSLKHRIFKLTPLQKVIENQWFNLPKSHLEEFTDFETVFDKEFPLIDFSQTFYKNKSSEQLKYENDFIISFTRQLVFEDLKDKDQQRFLILDKVLQFISTLDPFVGF